MTTNQQLDGCDILLGVATAACQAEHFDESIALALVAHDVMNGSDFETAFGAINERTRAYFWREAERANKEAGVSPGVSSLFAVARLASQNGDHGIAFEIVALAAAIRNGESERDSFRAMDEEAQKYLTIVMDSAAKKLALEDKQRPLQSFDAVWARCKFRN